MIISVNWLKKFTTIDYPLDEFVKLIGARLVEIEDVIDLGKKYKGAMIARVVSVQPNPDADRLNIVRIDDGGVTTDIPRQQDGTIELVCGAPNVREGLLVVWLPTGAVIPATFGTKEPLVLSARKIRGVVSNGMLASAAELAIGNDHSGIVEVTKKDAKPGDDFASTYELDDYLLDIENKSLTHRPDCFGIIGFAREVAAIQGSAFTTPESLTLIDSLDYGEGKAPTIAIESKKSASRFMAVEIKGLDGSKKSPLETQSYLARVGVNPINEIVDVTNYIMMLTGQPMHAYDLDKLKKFGSGKVNLKVRRGQDNDTLKLLDGREIKPTEDDIVIANGDKVVALAGAMGGSETEVDNETKNILLEAGTFDLYALRNTQFRHGIFTESITRQTKGLPPAQLAPIMNEAIKLIKLSQNVSETSKVADVYPERHVSRKVYAMAEHMNRALGSDFSTNEIRKTLEDAEFHVEVNEKGVITVIPPYWRTDIEISEDLDEEVGRINGYDTISWSLPLRRSAAVVPSSLDRLRSTLRQLLARSGANEVLTYSFIHGDILDAVGQDKANSFRVTNSISPDLQYYRQSLTPSLLGLIHPNIKSGADEFAVFELNKAHVKTDGLVDGVPVERYNLALSYAKNKPGDGASYYVVKRILDFLAKELNVTFLYKSANDTYTSAMDLPFESKRSALICDNETGEVLGIIGEYKKSVRKAFKLPEQAAGFELDLKKLLLLTKKSTYDYIPLSRYPSVERDICFEVNEAVRYADLIEATQVDSAFAIEVSPLDIYQKEPHKKRVTVRLKIVPHNKTLSGKEAASVVKLVSDSVVSKLGAVII